ncbi:DUF4179 domain-containing protein [Paenibacillus arenosi]|uniref:DUF4179 domain-containing protein n=1 Tax=Paenibacillus arenosi TaxID=2774142 RepID=A0ABR9AZX4_9BACL|nr:DUF4179 domain-containing protein [Paenibacillus arenosi]MBD8498755.1 DUF4179 domain-containing protein [Paenibacillus arenosi]
MKRVNQHKLDQQLKEELHRTQQAIPAVVQQRIDDTLSKLLEDTHEHAPVQSIPLPLPIAAPTSTRSTRRANKIWLWAAPAAAIVLGAAIISTAYYSPVIDSPVTKGALKQIPGIQVPETKSLFKMSNDLGLQIAAEQKVVQQLEDNTITQGPIRIRVKEVLYDGHRLSIGTQFQTDNSMSRETLMELEEELTINGKTPNIGNSTEIQKIDAHTYAIIINYYPLPNLASTFDVQIGFFHPAHLDSQWFFQFSVNRNDDGKRTYPLAHTASYQDMKLTAKELSLTTYSSELRLDFSYKYKLGMKYSPPLRFQMEDDQGNVLQERFTSGGSTLKNGINTSNKVIGFDPVSFDTKYLVIKPYLWNTKGPHTFIKELEFTIPLKK